MHGRWISILVLTIGMVFGSTLSHAAKQKKAVSGTSSAVQDVLLHVDQNYCDQASPYKYTDNGPDTPPSLVAADGSGQVDDPIAFSGEAPSSSKSLTITDPGKPILGQADAELAPDGSDAARLLLRTLALPPNSTPCASNGGLGAVTSNHFSFANAAYYLIDVVRWQAVKVGSGASYQVASDHWYVFDFSDAKSSHRKFPFTFHPFVTSDLRIFGDARHPTKTNVVFLAINLAPNDAFDDWSSNVDVSYKLHADKVIPANIQDLQLLVNFLVGKTAAERTFSVTKKIDFQGRYASALLANLKDLPAKLTSTMTTTFKGSPAGPEGPYCANVKKTMLTSSGKPIADCPATPAVTSRDVLPRKDMGNESNDFLPRPNSEARPSFLLAGLVLPDARKSQAQAPPGQDKGTSNPPPANPPSGNTNPTPVTQTNTNSNCDSSTTGDPTTGKTLQQPCTLTQTIKDEGLYHWDVSIAIPTPGYNETVFDSNNALMPKSVTRTNAYAMVDVAPWGEDFVNPPMFGIPHLMTGLPIAGKVFNKPFVGGLGEEVGLTKILPFSARVFAGVVYNKEFRGADQVPHRVWKVQYGIELSMSSAISKLKGSSTSK